jgi:uracil-DNA glycosylase
VRLWLRGERAFGLTSVAAPATPGESPHIDEANHAAPSAIAAVAPKSRAPAQERSAPEPERPFATVGIPNEMAPQGGLIAPATTAPLTTLDLSANEKSQRLIALDNNEVRGCTRCRLCQTRTNTVFGEGDPNSRIVFIGEGPGENEDLQGRPFVGRAGELLNKQITAMGFAREQVYIANVVKCRPPGNRQPAPDEAATCIPYLHRQLEIIAPRVIVTLGLSAARYMLDTKLSMTRLRGNWHTWRGIRLMPTFHPAYVLRQYTPETRAAVWSDLKQVLAELGLPVPQSKER